MLRTLYYGAGFWDHGHAHPFLSHGPAHPSLSYAAPSWQKMSESDAIKLDGICRGLKLPLLLARAYGLVGYLRVRSGIFGRARSAISDPRG